MRIGIFTDTYTPDINGVVSSIVTLQKGLEEVGHEVYIITSHKSFLHATREGNVFRMPGLELKWLYGYILSTPYHFTVKSEVEKLNLDVIHVHTEFGVGIFGRLVARALNIPVIYTYHTMYEDYTNYVNRFNLEPLEKVGRKVVMNMSRYLCDSVMSIVAPSEKTKDRLLEYGVKRPIYIIPTGLDMERFKEENVSIEKRNEIRKKYNITSETKLITYIGRVAEEKSIDIIIDGVPFIQSENCKVMIVGGGPNLEDLKKQAEKLGVMDSMIFTDKVSREDVAAYYLISDAFVSASTSETQGMTFIESLASGLCVFARPDEVLDKLVLEDETGFYFTSAKEFAQKVDHYLTLSDEKKKQLSVSAKKVVVRYDVKTFVRDILVAYEASIEDYEDCFFVKSIKSSNDCMKLYLDSKKTKIEETILVSLDDYTLYHLRKDDIMEKYIFETLKQREKILIANRMCIRKLCAKDRTRKEMYDFLIQQDKVELDIKNINDIIDGLEERGYINDEAYTVIQIDRMDHALVGKKQILRDLVQKGIPYEQVEVHLKSLNEDNERMKCEQMASKYMMSIRNKSIRNKKMQMEDKLYRDGFAKEIIKDVVNELNFEDDLLQERVILLKALEKVHKNYAKKYEGKQLRDRIFKYLMNKGFMYDDIKHAMEELEEHNE